jgi:streptogramin lyase
MITSSSSSAPGFGNSLCAMMGVPKTRATRSPLFGTAVLLLLAAAARAQTFTEYPVPTPNSQLIGITNGPDGNIWFSEQLGKKIGRITPQGVIAEFPIPGTLVSPTVMAAGPDGNVWFADFLSVGRVMPSGSIARFNIPSKSLPGHGITAGPDGNVWFTLFATDHQRIGRVTPTGSITEFPVFGGTIQLTGLASGPDGNIWFTDPLSNQIGQMTTSGAVTLFPMPAEVTGPFEIAAGPDGNLWFTSAFHIGRITTTGVVTLFPDPGGDFPRGIVAGPDGNMWYTESVGNNIGRITMEGVMTEFPIPTITSGPLDIAAGADGAIWFIERSDNKIGRITTGACEPDATTLCLNHNRFRLQVAWRAVHLGTEGVGQAIRLTEDTGYFWFFQSTNVELVIKILDARSFSGYFWVFYGALSNVEYTITVTDTQTQEVRTFFNPQDTQASVANTSAFPLGGGGASSAPGTSGMAEALDREGAAFGGLVGRLSRRPQAARASCVPTPTALCLNGNRFRLEVTWRAVHLGTNGVGYAVPLTADTGYFWFFQNTNVEVVIKVLDARSFSGYFWVFYGALSNVEYTITVTDTETQEVKTYFTPQDTLASVADTSAF